MAASPLYANGVNRSVVRFSPLSYNTARSPSEAAQLAWETRSDKQARRFGYAPDPTRPLRTDPVRREEVRFERRWRGDHKLYALRTMPLGTFRREVRTFNIDGDHPPRQTTWFVGEPGLWQPLWEQVAAELAAEYARRLQPPDFPFSPLEQRLQTLPEFAEHRVREYVCEHCGRGYLGEKLRGNERVCICSDQCESLRQKALQRQWRKNNPADYQRINAPRAKRRSDARTGRTCEHCGVPIEAARSTRRFCSDICRVRAHHAKQQAAQ